MKKTIQLFILLAIVASFSSCVSTNGGYQSSPVISRNVELDPIKADINVDTTRRLKGESTSTYFLSLRVQGDNKFADGINYSTDANTSMASKLLNPLSLISSGRLSKVRSAAAYKAMSQGSYDVLVHPSYVVTTENYLIIKKYTVEVTGYGATYSNYRTVPPPVIYYPNLTAPTRN